MEFPSVSQSSRKSQRADAIGRRSGGPRRVLSPGTLGDDVSHEIRTRHTKRFRSFGVQIESNVALLIPKLLLVCGFPFGSRGSSFGSSSDSRRSDQENQKVNSFCERHPNRSDGFQQQPDPAQARNFLMSILEPPIMLLHQNREPMSYAGGTQLWNFRRVPGRKQPHHRLE